MEGADKFLAMLADFDEILSAADSAVARKQCILQHFSKIDKFKDFRIPDFDKGLDWLNVSSPLQVGQALSLQGKVLVLDFFTYCCVNCLHVLPALHKLEQKYAPQDGLVIIGVHSAKFLNEKITANILSAILRYDITHPVVNDAETSLWQQLSIMCWPTFVIVGPDSQVLYYIVGEGHSVLLFEFVSLALEHYGMLGQLSSHTLPLSLERDKQLKSPLHFPGKVHVGPAQDQLVVSDSGNHRLLVLDRVTGIVQTVIGGKKKGFKDGDLQDALFNSPQGVASHNNILFVADTENHALRQVDLSRGQVTTLAGTGTQGEDKQGGNLGTQQALSSPWDVATGVSPGGAEVDVMYIAMAGTHQIWAYFLKNATWWKNRHYPAGSCVCLAGSGSEENRNNSYPEKAAFAQPSGLALSPSQALNALFLADSESSTIRQISLKDGSVKGVVGGDRDPKNLFAFGDVDGPGIEARLQHPLGVAFLYPTGPLLVADSYNHKIKSIDIKSKVCTTVLGADASQSAAMGDGSRLQLNEPGGLCVEETHQLVYIANTNNHNILMMDWKTKKVSLLPVIFSQEEQDHPKTPLGGSVPLKGIQLPEVTLQPNGKISFDFDFRLASGCHGNEDAPNCWKLTGRDQADQLFLASIPANFTTGSLHLDSASPWRLTSLKLDSSVLSSSLTLVLTCQVFVCRPDNTCTQHREQYIQVVRISPEGLFDHETQAVLEVK